MNHDEYGKMRDLEDHYWWFVARRRLALALLKKHAPDQPKTLDVGCGTGALLHHLQNQGEAHGLDYFPVALEFSQKRGLKNLLHGNAEAIPLQTETYDAVISLDTLEHVPNDEAAAQEIFRVLKPGGVFVMNVPAFQWLWGPHDVALMHQRRYTRQQVESLLQDQGFQIEKNTYSVFFLFPVVILRRLVEKRQKGPAQAKLPQVSEPVNNLLLKLMKLEASLLKRLSLPWGSSIITVARKPKG